MLRSSECGAERKRKQHSPVSPSLADPQVEFLVNHFPAPLLGLGAECGGPVIGCDQDVCHVQALAGEQVGLDPDDRCRKGLLGVALFLLVLIRLLLVAASYKVACPVGRSEGPDRGLQPVCKRRGRMGREETRTVSDVDGYVRRHVLALFPPKNLPPHGVCLLDQVWGEVHVLADGPPWPVVGRHKRSLVLERMLGRRLRSGVVDHVEGWKRPKHSVGFQKALGNRQRSFLSLSLSPFRRKSIRDFRRGKKARTSVL